MNVYFWHRDSERDAPETLPNLFKKFSRAPDASKANIIYLCVLPASLPARVTRKQAYSRRRVHADRRATGLGLYVARKLIEAQGGTIRAESEGEGKGATFIVELPIKT